MIQDNAIIFHSKVDMARILIRNIESLGKNTQDFNHILEELISSVDKKIANINIKETEKNARKMMIDGIYLEAIKEIDKIIKSIKNYLVYFKTMSNCEYISKLEKINDEDSSEEYVFPSEANDRLYIKMTSPYETDNEDYWVYELNYADYQGMSLEDIVKKT